MSFASTRRMALGGFLLAAACNGSAAAPAVAALDAGTDAAPVVGVAFSFDSAFACAGGALCAPPSHAITLGIEGPPGATIAVSLQGSYADAALSADHVTTTGGHAIVTLATSTNPATFAVVAHLGSDTSSLAVAVGASGFATIRATPTYDGKRAAPAFYGTALVRSTCAQASAAPPTDAVWLPAPNGGAIVLPVPAGERVAVDVRLGHYALGCADVDPLAASATRDLGLQVYDVPMALSLTNVNATFTFTPEQASSSALAAAMQTTATKIGEAFFASTGGGAALVDAMRTVVPATSQGPFDVARTQGAWDGKVDAWLSSHAPSIHDRAATWLTAAAADGLGALAMHMDPGASPGTASVTPTTLGSLAATLAGVASPAPFTWSADADDTVHLGGTVAIASTPLLWHLADAHARSAVSGALDVPSAIASGIDCQGLASSLVGSQDAYPGCNALCLGYVCANGLASAWTTAQASPAGGGDVLKLSLTVGAPAEVGDAAEPKYFGGGWLGQVDGPLVASPFSMKGTVTGIEGTAPTP